MGQDLIVGAPEPLAAQHQLDTFDCGVASLNEWLRRRAIPNQSSGASRTFVASCEGRVVAYYALAPSAVDASAVTGRFRRNMPDPIPVIVLGRLAIDKSQQGQGLGRDLLLDAARRTAHAAEIIGVRGLLVHAISEEAKAFYLQLGLDPSPFDPLMLMTTMADLRAAMSLGI